MPTTAWQEYTPDLYNLGDSIIISVGLASHFDSTEVKQEVIIRSMKLDGTVLFENYHYLFGLSNSIGYVLSTYYGGSTIYKDKIYVITYTPIENCNSNEYKSAKVLLEFDIEGKFLGERYFCTDHYHIVEDIIVNPANDSLYIHGAWEINAELTHPFISVIDTSLESNFKTTIVTNMNSSIDELLFEGKDIYLFGTTGKYDDRDSKPKIWNGRFVGNEIIDSDSFHYMRESIFLKRKEISENENAIFIHDKSSGSARTNILYFQDNIMQWNFYQAFQTNLNDIEKINEEYLILRTDYRDFEFRKYKLVLHHLDSDGYEFDYDEINVPWLWNVLNAIRIKDFYIVYVYTRNEDIRDLWIDGVIDGTVDQYYPVHIFKFKINE